jgi:hypothetical protein
MAARRTYRTRSPEPFGEVTLVPSALTGRPELEMGRAMAAVLDDVDMPAADALIRLRQAFPEAPPSARMAALNVIMERLRRVF